MFRSGNSIVICNRRFRTALLLQFLLITFMSIIQLFPIRTVPLSRIRLAYYEQFEYGVYGWCVVRPERHCTKKKVGYYSIDVRIPNQRLILPSESKYSVTKLLVMHLVSFGLSLVIWLMLLIALFSRFQDSPLYLLICGTLTMAMFIFALLSFLVDILLFQGSLNWPGWFMLVVAITSAFTGSMLWSYYRNVEIRNFTALNTENNNHPSAGTNGNRHNFEDQIATYPLEHLPVDSASFQSTAYSGIDTSTGPLLKPDVTYHGIVEG